MSVCGYFKVFACAMCVCLCARVLRGYKKNKALRKKNMKKLLYFPHLVKIPIGYLAVFKRLRFLLLY